MLFRIRQIDWFTLLICSQLCRSWKWSCVSVCAGMLAVGGLSNRPSIIWWMSICSWEWLRSWRILSWCSRQRCHASSEERLSSSAQVLCQCLRIKGIVQHQQKKERQFCSLAFIVPNPSFFFPCNTKAKYNSFMWGTASRSNSWHIYDNPWKKYLNNVCFVDS